MLPEGNEKKTLDFRVWGLILIVYQSAGIEKDIDSRQSLENRAKIDETSGFSNKKFDSSHDKHRAMIEAEEYSKPSKRGEYHNVSGAMGMSSNLFLSKEAGAACMDLHEVKDLLKFWKERITETDT